MRQVEHKLLSEDVEARTGVCVKCGPVRIYTNRVAGEPLGWKCGRAPPVRRKGGPSKGSGTGRKLAHALTEVDEVKRVAVCALCGPVRLFESKGRRARIGQRFVCSRQSPERGVGGAPTKHQLTSVDESAQTGNCAVCGPIKLVWRPYQNGGGAWGCWRTRFSIASVTSYKDKEDYKPAICPYCGHWHRWDRGQGKVCRARLVAERGNHCAVCKEPPSDGLRVDHDHQTGQVRGLLCRNCNVALGLLKDDRDRVADLLNYLTASGS